MVLGGDKARRWAKRRKPVESGDFPIRRNTIPRCCPLRLSALTIPSEKGEAAGEEENGVSSVACLNSSWALPLVLEVHRDMESRMFAKLSSPQDYDSEPMPVRKPGFVISLMGAGIVGLLSLTSAEAATPAEERLRQVRESVLELKAAVGRGDKAATRQIGASTERELVQLRDEIDKLPALRLAVGTEPVTLKYLGDRVPSPRLAGHLITQDGISEDLAALRAQVIPQRRYSLDAGQEVSLRYYPPADVFAVQDIGGGKQEAALDWLALVDRPQRFVSVLSRAIGLESAWRRADRMELTVRPEVARRLGLGEDVLRVRYLHTKAVSPGQSPGRAYEDLLREVRAQLEYVMNVKPEGPPLLAALKTGLVFDDEFGFEAWGGRWREFDGTVFFMRYGAARGEFLVTVERVREPVIPK